MKSKSCSSFLVSTAAVAVFAVSIVSGAEVPANSLYVSTDADLSYTTFVGPIPVGNLSLTLPASSALYNTAIVTLNMPNLYLSNPTSETATMSAEISIVAPFAPGGLVAAVGGIGCDAPKVATSGKKPITIVLKVPLGSSSQYAEAEWDSTNGTVNTDTFASISAILVRE